MKHLLTNLLMITVLLLFSCSASKKEPLPSVEISYEVIESEVYEIPFNVSSYASPAPPSIPLTTIRGWHEEPVGPFWEEWKESYPDEFFEENYLVAFTSGFGGEIEKVTSDGFIHITQTIIEGLRHRGSQYFLIELPNSFKPEQIQLQRTVVEIDMNE